MDTEEMEIQDWVDIDAESINDPHQVGLYAYHIFEYYKLREVCIWYGLFPLKTQWGHKSVAY